jgi:hypothetical protein
MKKILNEENYEMIRNFIISDGCNPNMDKCCFYYEDDLDVTLCFNDTSKCICICELYLGKCIDFEDIFEYLIYVAHMAKQNNNIDENKIDNYNKHIANQLCCECNQ